jgi:hypothetical protein
MEVEIKEVGRPMGRSFGMFAELNKEKITEEGKIRVVAELVTKTRIHTALYDGCAIKGINHAVDGIKTHREERRSHFDGGSETLNYFVKSKKQDYEVYKRYVEIVVNESMSLIGVDLEKIVVELELCSRW